MIILAHSGVSGLLRETDPKNSSLAATIQAVKDGYKVLTTDGSAVDAVEKTLM